MYPFKYIIDKLPISIHTPVTGIHIIFILLSIPVISI